MKVICPSCGKEIEVHTRNTDKYGFVVNSKGSFIAETITKAGAKGIKVMPLIEAVDLQYPGKNSLGRIQSVLNKLKKAGTVVDQDGVIKIQG